MSQFPPSLPGRRAVLAALAGGLAAGHLPAFAQDSAGWRPNRPIRFLVGFSAGGTGDMLARLIAQPMSQKLGTPIVVENIVGAGANIAMAALARSAPDGLTIGMGTPGTHAISPAIMGAKLPFHVPQDFTPITLLMSTPNVLIVNNNLGVNNIEEFKAWVRANPTAAFASAGVGTSNHLCGELLSERLGLKLTHVPYRGAAQVITDLLGGHVPMTFDNISTASPLIREGKVKAIAVTTAKRSLALPTVPTLAESGLPGYDLAAWQGLFGPRGLPAPVLQALYAATAQTLKIPEVARQLTDLGCEPGGQPPAAFAAYLETEFKRWGDIVRLAKITE